ncbi:putative glycoside hydrolase family 7 protein [Diaporthe ampelina]|uniref:Glucanase n=1 Tax=Diaporthe ampelina TaxID=1214573 RepID=A0A0G2FZM5_9PEZI|nr:putative glycoside hydrolase family 7 protein [Diaporthe ampelina]
MYRELATISALVATVSAQAACSLTTETHPPLTWAKCAAGGTCTNVAGSVTIDANWRWVHTTSGYTNCYTDYSGTYGITTSGNALNLKFVTTGTNTNIGSRTYLMESDTKYQMFTLLGNEFTFDVDVSNLPCGLNGALYFVSMDQDGGASKYPTNKAGAKYGTGYCDSQCPRDLKFINGLANAEGWGASTNDPNAGHGNYGSCCSEMDIWEANSISTAYTPHPCGTVGQERCEGDNCGGTFATDRYAGTCDPDGCDFNSYRQENTTFYGPGSGFTLDTTKKLTVVTQFLKGSDGNLGEIKRFYVQNGKVFENSQSNVAGNPGNSITTDYCDAQKTAFGDTNIFAQKGGLAQMGKAVAAPMVLVLSVWDDHAVNMLWLDSTFPVDKAGSPGAARGSCSTSSGVPAEIEKSAPNSNVVYSNIKFGPIGSTFNAPPSSGNPGSSSSVSSSTSMVSTSTRTSTTTSSSPTTSAPSTNCQAKYAQCGGQGWTGTTCCASGSTCKVSNQYYSQCL